VKKCILIGIAGGSGSGKTSLAIKLLKEYGNNKLAVIEQDSYYKNLAHLTFDERAIYNYDHPDAIDIDLFQSQLSILLNGRNINIPIYDFSQHVRLKNTKMITPFPVIIVEGILVLYFQQLRQLMVIKIYIDTPEDIRFKRRFNRDIKERGRTAESVKKQYISTVRPMHDKFVEPSKNSADIIILGHNNLENAIEQVKSKLDPMLKN
jgi:uridine kinase|tara:strand:- start:305 stop:925 length:621 start_codon:yes stop_codon:yes gene_type:complete